jgi:uncharacterized protein
MPEPPPPPPPPPPPRPATVRVVGTGEVSAPPDRLSIDLGVVCRSPTARQALSRANERAGELIALLVAEGVARTDIATRSIAVHPSYDDKGQKVTGYEASNDVVVVLRDLSRAGAVIDAAAGAVGDDIRMGALAFGIEDPSAVLADARRAAVDKATSQAQQLAAAAGVRLGSIRRIAEGTGGGAPPPFRPMMRALAAEAVPIEPGAQKLSVSVEIEWEIAPPD